jgi:hypothetical protein
MAGVACPLVSRHGRLPCRVPFVLIGVVVGLIMEVLFGIPMLRCDDTSGADIGG